MTDIAVVIPALNEERNIPPAFKGLRAVVDSFAQHSFVFYPIDDGSNDKTYNAVMQEGARLDLNVRPMQNPSNLGLAATLRKAYGAVLNLGAQVIIKTDVDLNHLDILPPLIGYAARDIEMLWTLDTGDTRLTQYEIEKRRGIVDALQSKGITTINPFTLHSQLFIRPELERLLEQPEVKAHNEKWGFDFMMALSAHLAGRKTGAVGVINGHYDPNRRADHKIDDQFRAYKYVINTLIGEK